MSSVVSRAWNKSKSIATLNPYASPCKRIYTIEKITTVTSYLFMAIYATHVRDWLFRFTLCCLALFWFDLFWFGSFHFMLMFIISCQRKGPIKLTFTNFLMRPLRMSVSGRTSENNYMIYFDTFQSSRFFVVEVLCSIICRCLRSPIASERIS